VKNLFERVFSWTAQFKEQVLELFDIEGYEALIIGGTYIYPSLQPNFA